MNIYKLDGDLYAFNAVRHWNDSNRTVLQYGFDRLTINAGQLPVAKGSSNEQDSTEGDFVLKHTYLLKGNALTGGVQWMKYIAPLGSAPTSGVPTDRTDDAMASWFVQDDYHMLGNRLVLDGGIRGDKTKNKNYNSTLKADSNEWSSTFKTLAFGATYKVTPKVNVAARYGYVNTPAASNYVYQTHAMSAPSSNLPTQTQNRGELSTNDNINPHFSPRVSIYIYDTTNGTAPATATTGLCTSPANAVPPNTKNLSSWTVNGNEIDCVSIAGDVKTAGTEVGFSGRLIGPFSYSTGYGYVGTDNTAVNKTMSHNFMNAGLNYHQRNWFGNFSMIYVGPLWSSASPGGTYYGELANYSRMDGNAGYIFKLFGKPMAFTAFERNMNDNNYATRYVTGAYRDPGRQYGVELAGKVF
jgi:iron complex outermembrane receptor protein